MQDTMGGAYIAREIREIRSALVLHVARMPSIPFAVPKIVRDAISALSEGGGVCMIEDSFRPTHA